MKRGISIMRKRLFLLTLCGLLILSCAACGASVETEETNETKNNLPTRPHLSLPSADTQQTVPVAYVPDEAVNKFILALKEQFVTEDGGKPEEYVLGIEQGNSQNEYVLTVQGCRITVSSHKNGLNAMILSGRGEKGQKSLFSAFRIVAAAADSSCTGSQCQSAINFMQQQTAASGSYRVSNYIQILSYMPSVQLEGSETDCRLDLLLTYFSSGTPGQ